MYTEGTHQAAAASEKELQTMRTGVGALMSTKLLLLNSVPYAWQSPIEMKGRCKVLLLRLLDLFLRCVCECSACMSIYHVNAWCQWKSGEGTKLQFPGTGVSDGCELQ